MVIGKEAQVEEFALHRIGSGDTPSVFSDFTVVLKGEEEQEFLRKLFLKPFANMAFTTEFTHAISALPIRLLRFSPTLGLSGSPHPSAFGSVSRPVPYGNIRPGSYR